jgi:hypothetical protein
MLCMFQLIFPIILDVNILHCVFITLFPNKCWGKCTAQVSLHPKNLQADVFYWICTQLFLIILMENIPLVATRKKVCVFQDSLKPWTSISGPCMSEISSVKFPLVADVGPPLEWRINLHSILYRIHRFSYNLASKEQLLEFLQQNQKLYKMLKLSVLSWMTY